MSTTLAEEPDVVLAVRDLRVRAGSTELVHGVDLTLRAGERVGLIGASGSGKTVTSTAIAGLLGDGVGPRPSALTASGSIRLRGVDHDVVGASEARLSRVRGRVTGMVFQEPMAALNPTMRVGRQITEAVLAHRGTTRAAARERTLEMLGLCGFPDPERVERSYPHQLSGGQLQRIVLSIAMVNRPDLLICDEPTTALDVTVQARMLDVISAQVDAVGSALLFISHDLAVVASICDRLVVMYQGDVVEEGSVIDVLENPRHEHTRRLMADADLDLGRTADASVLEGEQR